MSATPTSMTSAAPTAASEGRRPSASVLRRAFRFPTVRVGLVLVLAVFLFAFLGPYFAPHTTTEFVGRPFQGPSSDALLGTDQLGRDVLSRLMWGGRSILWMAVASAFLGVGVGAALGLIAGYTPKIDNLIMRPLEVIQGFPALVLILLFTALLGPKVWLIILLVALFNVPSVARVTRGMTLDIASRDFVAAAQVIGFPRRHILYREVLPNISTPLFVELGLRITYGIAITAALSFTGNGLQPPSTDWGLLLNENRTAMAIQPWPVIAPSVLIATFAIGVTLLTEGVSRTMARVDREPGT
ncbi:MAG TPA: ABC transporter permease [Baekduia sp.]|nr:ABC transporter permease [Baekduia sp.]